MGDITPDKCAGTKTQSTKAGHSCLAVAPCSTCSRARSPRPHGGPTIRDMTTHHGVIIEVCHRPGEGTVLQTTTECGSSLTWLHMTPAETPRRGPINDACMPTRASGAHSKQAKEPSARPMTMRCHRLER